MNVKELIEELKKLPQDLPIRTDNQYPEGENEWIDGVECSRKGESGYELEGEVRLSTSLGYKFDILVSRDCTVPFIRNTDIHGSVELLKKSQCDGVFGAYKQHHNPYFNMMEKNSSGFLRFSKKSQIKIKSRQDAPIVYQLNGLVTIYVDKFLKYGKTCMPKILPYEVSPEAGFMIDTEFEFQIAARVAEGKIKILL